MKKAKIQKAIQEAANRLLRKQVEMPPRKLYLTKKQYECDPDGWHDVLRQRGLPDDAIVIIPEVFRDK